MNIYSPFNPNDIVIAATQLLEKRAKQRKIKINVHLFSESIRLIGDVSLYTMLVVSALKNAIRLTKNNRIEIGFNKIKQTKKFVTLSLFVKHFGKHVNNTVLENIEHNKIDTLTAMTQAENEIYLIKKITDVLKGTVHIKNNKKWR